MGLDHGPFSDYDISHDAYFKANIGVFFDVQMINDEESLLPVVGEKCGGATDGYMIVKGY